MEGQILPATDKKHKWQVAVFNPETGRLVTVRFGAVGYADFTQHRDPERRRRYLLRSAGIRDRSGRLTKDNPLSPNYWSRRVLWESGEPW